MLFLRSIALLAASCAVWAQTPATPKLGSIRGTVVTTAGEPVRKAEVTLTAGRADSMQRLTTDASGTFVFEGLQPGNYQLLVQRNGYVGATAAKRAVVRASGAAVSVGSGQEVTGITIRMIPHGVIAGKVIDEDGEPLASVTVQILRERWTSGRRQLIPMNMDATNDLGEYRIAGLAPGRYFLMAAHDRMMQAASRQRGADAVSDLVYVTMYYPGVPELSQSSPVIVAPGQVAPADFQLRRHPAFRVRGTVVDEGGRPVQGVSVMASPADGSLIGVRAMGLVRGADGAFILSGLTPGSYTLMANRQRRGTGESGTARATVQVGNRDVDGIQLTFVPGFAVSGVVRLPEGVDIPQARVMLRPIESSLSMPAPSGQVQSNGTWSIADVSAGKFHFSLVGLPQGLYVKSVLAGGQEVSGGAFISAAASGVEITVAANAPTIRGTAIDGEKQPVGGATIVLVPSSDLRDRWWLFRFVTSDQRGGFSLGSMAPGNYTVLAFREVEEGIWYGPDFLTQVESKGTVVKVAEGAAENIQVTVQ